MSFSMSLAAPAVAVAFIDKSLLIGSGANSGPLLPTPQTSLLGTPQMVFISNVFISNVFIIFPDTYTCTCVEILS